MGEPGRSIIDVMTQAEREQLRKNTQDIARLLHQCPKIVEFTVTPLVAELGSSVTVTVSARISGEAETVKLFRGEEVMTAAVSDSGVVSGQASGVSQPCVFRVKATDALEHTISAEKSVAFQNGVYTGAGGASTAISSLNKTLQASRAKTFTVTAGAGEYVWYACPVRYGSPVFKVGGFEGGFELVRSEDYTNPSGYTEGYQLWRSTNANLGTMTVTVS